MQAGSSCTENSQCKSQQCVMSYKDHISYKCSSTTVINICSDNYMLVLFDDFSTDCKGALGKHCPPQQQDVCAFSCYPQVGSVNYMCSQKFLDCSQQTGTVSAILTSSQPIYEICAKINGEICSQSDECLSGSCYQLYEDLNIKKCSQQINCGSNIPVYIGNTESSCKLPNGGNCIVNDNCLSKACYPSFDNNANIKCSVPKTCSTKESQVFIDNSISQCKKIIGEICVGSLDCINQQCYSDISHQSDKKCAKLITCTSNQIQYYLDQLNSDCKAINGQNCSDSSNCVSNACYLTLNDSTSMKCSVPITCSQPNIGYFKDDSNSKCFNPGGETCLQNDETCAYGCFQFQFGSQYKCSAGTPAKCDAQNVGLMKTPDYLVKCYLVADQDCSQANDLCQFMCLKDLDQNKLKCSSQLISCTGQFQPFIQSKMPVCKLNIGISCSDDSDCVSNACYVNFNNISQKFCAKLVNCATRIPVYINVNNSSCKLSIGDVCKIAFDCINKTCYPTETGGNKCSVPTTCISPTSQYFQDSSNSVCKLAVGLSCSNNSECGSNQCSVDFSNINQYICAMKITCGSNQTQVYIDSSNSICKQNVGETCSTIQNQDCVSKACYQTVVDLSVSKCSIPITCTSPQSQYFQDNTQSSCKLAIGIDCTNNSECSQQACYLTLSNSSNKCAIPITCISPALQYYQDNSMSVCKISNGLDCQNNSECFSNSCFINFNNIMQKNCAKQISCGPNETQVYIDKNISACKLNVGQTCSTSQNTDCVTKACYQTLVDNTYYKCSKPITCISPSTQYFKNDLMSVCKLANGLDCSDNSECLSGFCYPVVKSASKKCSSSSIECSSQGRIPALDSQNTPICVLDTGSTCLSEGPDDSCLSGICSQVKNQPSALKCVSLSSISTCQSCDSTHKCVTDSNSIGSCLFADGNTGCTSDAVCANQCLLSLDNQFICSISCGECDSQKCISEPTGKQPKCKQNDLNGGIIAGIVIAIIFVVFSFFFICFCLIKRRKQKKETHPEEQCQNQQGITSINLSNMVIEQENVTRLEVAEIHE
ncbi:Proteasome_activator complex subunit 3 [Hexamita inflata]|uniref:Proteasome activator complex subunit 3 n=1 Tax=Hexamita inflata TaxID=28002 RepID=A0AA86PBK5_9EUKA|nr:Proteasome activator complex subunit 3 [Hexamita inflata]CAI9937936.1 Proteasome activator complex subunit 3 [Hexamita inflata]